MSTSAAMSPGRPWPSRYCGVSMGYVPPAKKLPSPRCAPPAHRSPRLQDRRRRVFAREAVRHWPRRETVRAGRWQAERIRQPSIEVPSTAMCRRRSLRESSLMANRSQDTWYVSFELPPPAKRGHGRATETFPSEREAKKFARAKLAETQNVSAGTLNPHLPKRTIASAHILEWLEE